MARPSALQVWDWDPSSCCIDCPHASYLVVPPSTATAVLLRMQYDCLDAEPSIRCNPLLSCMYPGVKATYGYNSSNAKRIGTEGTSAGPYQSVDLKLQPSVKDTEVFIKADYKFSDK